LQNNDISAVDLNNVAKVGNRSFFECLQLTSLDVGMAQTIGNEAF
jgi:hypothetical protein